MTPAELSAAVAAALAEAGTTTVFGVPGGGNNLDLIGAAEAEGLRFVLAHAETPAAIMASVFGDLTGSLAACIVTRGPGATSMINGVANALLDRQQLLLITDVVASSDAARIAHQRVDQRALFAPVTKWTAVAGAGDPQATVAHAARVSMSHPRGPVHVDFDASAASTAVPPSVVVDPVAPTDVVRLAELLAGSSRPVLLLGVGARHVGDPVRELAAASDAPVLMTYRAKGLVPDSWSCVAGLLSGATTEAPILDAADLIVMIGVDTVELIPNTWPYSATVVAIAEWAETSPYLTSELELVGDLGTLVGVVHEHWPATEWEHGAGAAHRDAELANLFSARPADPNGVVPQDVVVSLRRTAPARTVATVDAGAHMFPAMSFWATEEVDEVLISSGLATMGFALPAAIGASLARPGSRVVCFTGDGGLGMFLGELETVRRLDLPITIVVFNDAGLSLIAIKAKPEGNGGAGAVRYTETDFAAVARGYGISAHRVATLDELDAAAIASCDQTGPTLIDVRVDPSAYSDVVAAIRGARPAQGV